MPGPSVITIGNFDGPHVGHLRLLEQARAVADRHGGASVVVLTFDPPPVRLLRPEAEPPRITALDERIKRLRNAGADRVEILRPDAAMLEQTPQAFVDDLVRRYGPVGVVEGPDFRFGRHRSGSVETLRELGERHGFETQIVPPQRVVLSDLQTTAVSSSLVRWLIGRGRVADAAICLGRAFSLRAPVVRGEQRGRSLGVPTANFDPQELAPYILPADGVYAAYAEVDGISKPGTQARLIPAAVSVGVKPTFGRRSLTLEAHLLDVDQDLYGKTITLHFARWLRDQYPFPGVDALRMQLQKDIAAVRRWSAQPASKTHSLAAASL